MTTKPPTPQAVGAALKRAGFQRTESSGCFENISGYKVRKSRTVANAVEVRWTQDSRAPGPDKARCARMLLRYADALLLAGFRSQLDEPGEKLTVYARRGSTVTVTRKAEQWNA